MRLATPNGHPVGWIVPPARRTALAIGWDGRIRGRRVSNGNYLVRLVYRSSVLATAPLRIDDASTPAARPARRQRVDSVRRRLGPAHDGLAERRRFPGSREHLVPPDRGSDRHDGGDTHGQGAASALHRDGSARARAPHADVGPRHEPQPAHLPRPAHVGRSGREPGGLRGTERLRRPQAPRPGRAPPGNRRGLHEAELSARRRGLHPRRQRRAVARVARVPVRPREGGDLRRQPVRGNRGRRGPGDARLEGVAEQAAHDRLSHPDADEWPLLRPTQRA